MKYLALLTACFGLSLTAAAVNVTVTTPGNNQQVGTPFTLTANASSNGHQIVGWHIYLDGNNVYTAGTTSSITASITASQGNHQVVTRAWDNTGAYGDETETVVVSGSGGGGDGGGNGLPTPPGNAIWFNNIQNRGNWSWCHDPGCAGGSGSGTYWMSQHQSSPSRSGSSSEFYNSGVWGNALFWQKVGANDSVHNFLWDFWVYLDGNSQNAAQALEFDAFQFVRGYNYMIGTECVYPSGKWDTWDEASGHWVQSSLTCPRFSPNTWHHIQWYMTTNTSAHTYTFVTLVVDGNSRPVNITNHAKNLGWSDNVGVQWQIDVNASGEGYHEWIDSASLAIW